MDWFKENAAAIQAIAGVVGALTTLALAAITYWYVRVTSEIAKSSVEQVRLIREEAQANQLRNTRALASLAARIRRVLGSLDADEPKQTNLRTFNQVSDNDAAQLEALAWHIDNSTLNSACGRAIVAIRDIFEIIRLAKAGMTYAFSNEQVTRWKRAREESDRSLHEIENECQIILK